MKVEIQIEPIEAVAPSTYNPRKADKERLNILSLSLRKLGFLSPIFATKSGEIISGHQRHLTATTLGMTHVPVCRIDDIPLEKRKAINILFNRGTNDLRREVTSSMLRKEVAEFDFSRFEGLPDIYDTDGFAPCANTYQADLRALGRQNAKLFNNGARNSARQLHRAKCFIPVVTCEGDVVNGIGRVQYYLERGITEFPAVEITREQQELSSAMLNKLSMDFDIHNRYEDTLRHNSFRRSRLSRDYLGTGFYFFIKGAGTKWDVTEPKNAQAFKDAAGLSVVDFGAGHLHETNILRSIGVEVSAFEPYHITGKEQIDKEASLAIVRKFLAEIADGRKFSSVFISNVLNSVPFEKDRQHIACLAAALCSDTTTLRVATMSRTKGGWRAATGANFLSDSDANGCSFPLEYEEGVMLGDFGDKPKVQKFHTAEELAALFSPYMKQVEVREGGGNVFLEARRPRHCKIRENLTAAVEFEFDLPYPDGTRMGLVADALAAYRQRLGE